MSKKLYGLLLPVLAVAALAATTSAAQAQPRFFYCMKPGGNTWRFTSEATCIAGTPEVTNGTWERSFPLPAKPLKVKTHGTVTFHALGNEIECQVKDKGTIWDESGVGHDEISEFKNENCVLVSGTCVNPELAASNLNWHSELEEPAAGEIRDAITGTTITVICNKTAVDQFNKGTLTPLMVNGSPTVGEFDAGSGELEDSSGNKATVTGSDAVEGESGEAIAVE